jgi:hypothetical protein
LYGLGFSQSVANFCTDDFQTFYEHFEIQDFVA